MTTDLLSAPVKKQSQITISGERKHDSTNHPDAAATSHAPWVLCVEDDQDFSRGVKLRLQSRGYDVVRAFESDAGYRFAFEFDPVAILLDLNLPNGNGEDLLAEFCFHPRTADIPVIVVTGMNEPGLEDRLLLQGATAFFRKPISHEALAAEIHRLATE
jgi:DNA-binding response OmpR family regulator